jgi:hypothetical protein
MKSKLGDLGQAIWRAPVSAHEEQGGGRAEGDRCDGQLEIGHRAIERLCQWAGAADAASDSHGWFPILSRFGRSVSRRAGFY